MRFIPAALLMGLYFVSLPPARALPGDVDADGSVTLNDTVAAARIAASASASQDPRWLVADVAGPAGNVRDDVVDWRDVARLTRAAAGMEAMPDAPVDVLGHLRQSVDVPGDTTRDFQIPAVPGSSVERFTVQGHVTGLPAGVSEPTLSFYRPLPSGGLEAASAAVGGDGAYALPLAPAEYQLYFGGWVEEPVSGGTLRWAFKSWLNRTVTVAGPAIVDAAAAPPPLPGELAGSFFTTNILPIAVTALSHPEPFRGFPDPTKAALVSQGVLSPNAYRLKAVPTTQRVTFQAGYTGDPALSYTLTLGTNPDLPAGQTVQRNVSVPAAAPVTINVQPPVGMSVANVDLSMSLGGGAVALKTAPKTTGANTFASALPPGSIDVDVSIRPETPPSSPRLYRTRRTVTAGLQGGAFDLTLPPLPALVTLRGTVTYPNGVPAAGVAVAVGTAPARLSGSSEYGFSAQAVTDAQGRYEIRVPADRYIVDIPPLA